MIKKIKSLTRRELEIVKLIGEGYTTQQLAKELFISIETVRTHRKRILYKTKAKNMMTVVISAVLADMITITMAA
ncbi:MAG: two component transcriptional regulator, LuxR family [Bacteroidetes bacterium]|nr:two component transcriptional regulator, LuxR family [Bacteroidota bacterium]